MSTWASWQLSRAHGFVPEALQGFDHSRAARAVANPCTATTIHHDGVDHEFNDAHRVNTSSTGGRSRRAGSRRRDHAVGAQGPRRAGERAFSELVRAWSPEA